MIRRLSLASIVCPTAPFLVPRLLCAQTPLVVISTLGATASPCSQQSSYATKVTKWRIQDNRKSPKGVRKAEPFVNKTQNAGRQAQMDDVCSWVNLSLEWPLTFSQLTSLLGQFQEACRSRQMDIIMDLYPTLVASKCLIRNNTRELAQAVHAHIRSRTIGADGAPRIFPFIDRIVADIRAGILEPHPFAHMHILGVYKECKMYQTGVVFWQWLVDQGDAFVNQGVYGAAIELLAYQGETSLPQLEELYKDGLKRFPGTFAEYHLSPEAIVPDRSQRTNIVGLPILLLQGIMTARLLARDWRQAYLALDTALRLYPTETPVRFFDIFIRERPVSEGYTIFLLACRCGVVFPPYQFTTLLSKLQSYSATCSSLRERVKILQGMANAMYAYLECGGTLEGPHIGSFLNTFGTLLPWKQPGEPYDGDKAKLRNIIISQAHTIMSNLIQAGMPPQPQLFIALVSLAGKLEVPELLQVTLQDIETSQFDIGSIGHRCVLAAAGFLGEKRLIADYWAQIVSKGELEGSRSSHIYWVTLAKACRAAGFQSFFDEQVQKLQHAISVDAMREASFYLQTPAKSKEAPAQSYTLMDPEDLAAEFKGLEEHMKNIAAVIMSGQPLNLRHNPFYMSLFPERRFLGSTDDLRAVYDELTTDPHQPPPAVDASSQDKPSSIGIPFDELRFQNWVTIVELMNEAKSTEFEFQRQLDNAISNHKPLEGVFSMPTGKEFSRPPLALKREELRRYIRQLRAPTSLKDMGISTSNEGSPSIPKLRYHITSKHIPTPSVDSTQHQPLGKPQWEAGIRYHVAMEANSLVAPPPPTMRTSYRPLRSLNRHVRNQIPDEGLEEGSEEGSEEEVYNNEKDATKD